MQINKIEDFKKGWFVGNFEPSLIKTNDVEVAVKSYKAGDSENEHYHKIATEITVVNEGVIKMNGIEYVEGDIIKVYANESVKFESITNAVCTVVKYPGANNDKYDGFSIQNKESEKSNLPTEAGFYWVVYLRDHYAKSDGLKCFKSYNMTIEVYGTPPFLKIRGIKYGDDYTTKIEQVDLKDILHFGPKIEKPKLIKEDK